VEGLFVQYGNAVRLIHLIETHFIKKAAPPKKSGPQRKMCIVYKTHRKKGHDVLM
jgi:hypothetical protein